MMILAGDIGGTKTILALYDEKQSVSAGPIAETRFESAHYDSLETIIGEFLKATGARPDSASFGVAGPVVNGESQVTNLPWHISLKSVATEFGIARVKLLNDLEAIATAVPHLQPDALHTLNPGTPEPHNNIVVVAPGTGLGAAFLIWTGNRYKACASEAGHAAFSPRTLNQRELLKYMLRRYDHVSFERICAGRFLPNIYEFFRHQGSFQEPEWLRKELEQASDPTPIIIQNALQDNSDICEATLDMFVNTLGCFIGNLAVTLLPTSGIYLGGGIPPRILSRLEKPDFLNTIADKGRFSSLCANIPLHVILDPKAALHGSAWAGLER